MAQKHYTYADAGVTAAYLAQQVPGSGTVVAAVPVRLQTIIWDESAKDDLDAAMASAGWAYLFEGDAPAAKTILQTIGAFIVADAASIAEADGWVNVKTQTLVSKGGTVTAVLAAAVGNTGSGQAQARLVVDGGAYNDTVVGSPQYDIHNSAYGAAGFNIPVPLADTSPNDTTYTFKLQFSVTGVLSTVVPRAWTGFSLVEHK